MMKHLIFWTFLLLYSCSSVETFSPEEVEKEATAFMEAYAKDLLAQDKAAIVARYSAEGAYLVFNENNDFRTQEDLHNIYQNWVGPEAFNWIDLTYEVLSKDAVVVTGQFNWGTELASQPMKLSYTGLLIKQNGEFKIRLENESMNPFRFIGNLLEMKESPFKDSLIERSLDPALVKEVVQAFQQ